MEELTFQEVDVISGGEPVSLALAGTAAGLWVGLIVGYNGLTQFGAGLGIGIYDALH